MNKRLLPNVGNNLFFYIKKAKLGGDIIYLLYLCTTFIKIFISKL
jgi:hypothetical protein